MRALGIPARWSPATRAAPSMAWTATGPYAVTRARLGRSLVADRGWVRVDPTTAVAPGRTGDLRLAPPRNAVAQVLATVSPPNQPWACAPFGTPSTTAGTSGAELHAGPPYCSCCKTWV